MTESKVKEYAEREFPSSFNKYQASWLKGPYQLVARGSESASQTIKDLSLLMAAFKTEFPEVYKQMVEESREVEKKQGSEGWLKECPKCRGEMTFRKGVSKESGKPWAGWFCNKPKEECDGVIWE